MLPGVSKTAILTLRARVDEHARPDRVLDDPLAAAWWTHVEWPAELDAWYAAQVGVAFRADDIDRIAARYAAAHGPLATVAELGVGLSTRWARLGALDAQRWLEVDLPEVIALRQTWGVGGERHHQVAASVLDPAWMDALVGAPDRHLFIMEGLLYYLPRADVDALFVELRRRFPGSAVIMDVLGPADYPNLRAFTERMGAPIQWKNEVRFDAALASFGLEEIAGLELDRLADDMLARYWHRLDDVVRGAVYVSRHNELLWQLRSGNVIGRLSPR